MIEAASDRYGNLAKYIEKTKQKSLIVQDLEESEQKTSSWRLSKNRNSENIKKYTTITISMP